MHIAGGQTVIATTIKLTAIKSIVVKQAASGQGVEFSFTMFRATAGSFTLSNSLARSAGRLIAAASDKQEHSTLNFDDGRTLDIGPAISGIGAELHCSGLGSIDLTPDQCGVLVIAIDCAISPFSVKYQNKHIDGLRCQGDGCAAGQLPCPTPGFCGCKAAA